MEWSGRIGYGRAEVAHVMGRLGLEGLDGRHPYDLSGGQQQLLALGKLLLTRPGLLLLDEPTKGLDPTWRRRVALLVRELADRGTTVIMATHDLGFARQTSDSVSMLFDGSVSCTQAPGEFFRDNLFYQA
jgi:energy-coupling factor transport system ATP-binding protein